MTRRLWRRLIVNIPADGSLARGAPAECLFEVEYEKLINDREKVTRELVAFTGCAWDQACLEPERNERPVSTASLWQARQPVYSSSVARWRNYQPWLGELDRC